jgi:predicted ABC-type sugar transport system permease subunit
MPSNRFADNAVRWPSAGASSWVAWSERLGSGAGALVAFLVIVIAASLLSPSFLTARNLSNLLVQSSVLGLVAIGMTFVILGAGIDLSVGTVFSLSSVVAALLFDNGHGYSLPAVIAAIVLLGTAVGLLNAGIILWRGVAPFIVTLATMAIASGAALTISGGRPIGGISGTYAWIGSGSIGPAPVLAIILLCAFAVGAFTLRATPFGRYVYAIGGNEEAARLSGLRDVCDQRNHGVDRRFPVQRASHRGRSLGGPRHGTGRGRCRCARGSEPFRRGRKPVGNSARHAHDRDDQ